MLLKTSMDRNASCQVHRLVDKSSYTLGGGEGVEILQGHKSFLCRTSYDQIYNSLERNWNLHGSILLPGRVFMFSLLWIPMFYQRCFYQSPMFQILILGLSHLLMQYYVL
jgi:hypothetical protein